MDGELFVSGRVTSPFLDPQCPRFKVFVADIANLNPRYVHQLGGGFKHFLFSPLGVKIPNLTKTHIFQLGLFKKTTNQSNHQPPTSQTLEAFEETIEEHHKAPKGTASHLEIAKVALGNAVIMFLVKAQILLHQWFFEYGILLYMIYGIYIYIY